MKDLAIQMTSIEEIKLILKENMELLGQDYNVGTIGIFGSYVRKEQDNESDVDILVEFNKPIGFFKFLELEEYLASIIGKKVDLVSKKALKPRIGKRILKEAVFV